MNFKNIYEEKKSSIDAILDEIKSGDVIFVSECANEPMTILSNLHKLKDRGVKDIKLIFSFGLGKYKFMEEEDYDDFFDIESFFYHNGTRKFSQKNENCSIIPINIHDSMPRKLFCEKPNIYIGAATPMDKHGYVRTSLTYVFDSMFIENAEKVILEINPNLPKVDGETQIHIKDITKVIEVDTPLPTIPASKITEIELEIGKYISTLVNDGDTIQLGIGSIPDAVAISLENKKDLGIHTEMINDGMMHLMKKGVVTNKKKNLHKGKSVGAFALGSKELYEFLDENPSILILDGKYVNDPKIIAQNDNMISINTAIEVDLTGQVASEAIGYKQYSGAGGQMDTAYGAIHSKNGKSIIALKSTAKNGSISTINPILTPGAIVTLSRNVVDYIVTEYGIAQMKGKSVKERAKALINIAHPKFREELTQKAKLYRFI